MYNSQNEAQRQSVSECVGFNPLKRNSSNYYTLPFRHNLPFLISDIQALWCSALSAKVPECQKLKNGRLGLYGAEHLKCNHKKTLGFKGLTRVSNRSAGMICSRFPGNIFTKIQQNLQFYRHSLGRVTNPWDHTDPVYPSNSSVKGHLPGIDSPNIN